MAKIVAKFGGTSVADVVRIERAADKIKREVDLGHKVAVVVSAMSGVTNALIAHCSDVYSLYDASEYDSVVSSGEQVTAGLMAIALQKRGISARSWLGWQVPIICSELHGRARILEIDPTELNKRLDDNEVAVLAGFQGITHAGRIATLGRGGSDTTAVALAAAIGADRCDIYTDVEGVFTTDPRIVASASKLNAISYEEMLEMASSGAKVLQTRSVEMAFKREVPVQVLSSFGDKIGSDLPGTMVVKEDETMEEHVVNGITYSRDDAKITLLNLKDIPGVAAKVFGPLSEANVNVDMIVQDISTDGKLTDMTFTVPRSDVMRAKEALLKAEDLKGAEILSSTDVAKISVVGIGMRSHAGVAQQMFAALADKGINIQVISTSEIKISVLIAEEYTELAVRTLHSVYGLENIA